MDHPSEAPEGPRRSARRTVRNRYRVPSPEHYVGYVADEETPEMIMKKFAELDRVMEGCEAPVDASSPSHRQGHSRRGSSRVAADLGREREDTDVGLTADQLKTLCEATGASEVRDAFRSDAEFLEPTDVSDAADSDEEFELSEEDLFWDESEASSEKKTKTKRPKIRLTPPSGVAPSGQRVVKKQSNGLIQLRVPPPPIPPSWGRVIQSYGSPIGSATDPVSTARSCRFDVADVVSAKWSDWGGPFIGVMVLPLWRSLAQFEALALRELCPEGFLFLWIPKRFLQAVWRIVKGWGYLYVENLTWVDLQPSTKIAQTHETAALLPRAHQTLYIFRRSGKGKDIEIRHQRSPDVVFDVSRVDVCRLPKQVYDAIETMLPGAHGKLLELWSAAEGQRLGWVHIHEETPNPSSAF